MKAVPLGRDGRFHTEDSDLHLFMPLVMLLDFGNGDFHFWDQLFVCTQ